MTLVIETFLSITVATEINENTTYAVLFDYKNLLKGLYSWTGDGEPQQPTINVTTGEIIA